jgi:nicotinate-nucleotide adenylyltransferase
MRLGIFGGTFDPPHFAHLALAAEAQYQLQLTRILWVLTPIPPHKKLHTISPVTDRLAMLSAAIAGNPGFELSRIEIDRPPPYYAADTLHLLHQQHPKDELVYLLGSDSLQDLPAWQRPQEFLEGCDALGVMHRPGAIPNLTDLEAKLPGLQAKIEWISAPLLQISAREIRRRATAGEPFRYYLPESVYFQIIARGLYYSSPQSFLKK